MLSTSTSSVSLYAPGRISMMSPGTHRSSAAWIDSPGLMRSMTGWRCCRLGFESPPAAAAGIIFAGLGFKDALAAVAGITPAGLGLKDAPTAIAGIKLAIATLGGGSMAEPRAFGVRR